MRDFEVRVARKFKSQEKLGEVGRSGRPLFSMAVRVHVVILLYTNSDTKQWSATLPDLTKRARRVKKER